MSNFLAAVTVTAALRRTLQKALDDAAKIQTYVLKQTAISENKYH